jgi:hypothetical protein
MSLPVIHGLETLDLSNFKFPTPDPSNPERSKIEIEKIPGFQSGITKYVYLSMGQAEDPFVVDQLLSRGVGECFDFSYLWVES